MPYLVDMHTHTRESSACASQSADELLASAEQVGLDGVVITDHSAIEGGLKAERLARRRGVRVFVGVEVLTEEIGDVLVYGLRQEFPNPPVPLRRLVKAAEKDGAVLFAAHPFRRSARSALWAYLEEEDINWRREMKLPEILRPLTGVEVFNGGATPQENEEAALFAARFHLRGIAGSDAHNAWRVGWCATQFEFELRDEQELVQALRMGRFRVSRRQSEFDTASERRNHIRTLSQLNGPRLDTYVEGWRRRKPRQG